MPGRAPRSAPRDRADRIELGDTVEALGRKTDVKASARAPRRSPAARGGVANEGDAGQRQGGRLRHGTARSNPLPFAIGAALAVGFLIGRITKGD